MKEIVQTIKIKIKMTDLSVIDRIDRFFEYKFLLGEQPHELKLPKCVKISKKKIR